MYVYMYMYIYIYIYVYLYVCIYYKALGYKTITRTITILNTNTTLYYTSTPKP